MPQVSIQKEKFENDFNSTVEEFFRHPYYSNFKKIKDNSDLFFIKEEKELLKNCWKLKNRIKLKIITDYHHALEDILYDLEKEYENKKRPSIKEFKDIYTTYLEIKANWSLD